MSYSNRRPSSGRPSVTPRRKSGPQKMDDDFIYECKAAYLVVFEDLDEEIKREDQLIKAMQQAGRNPSRKVLRKYWSRNTDRLTFHDFCEICLKEPATSEDELLKAFKKIDLNGDGYLSNSELRKVLTTKGEKMTEAEVAAIIDEVDENKDGKLDYREFCTFVLKTQEDAKQFAIKNMKRKHGQKKKDSSSAYDKNLEVASNSSRRRREKDTDSMASMSHKSESPLNSEPESDEYGSQTSLNKKNTSKTFLKGSSLHKKHGSFGSESLGFEVSQETSAVSSRSRGDTRSLEGSLSGRSHRSGLEEMEGKFDNRQKSSLVSRYAEDLKEDSESEEDSDDDVVIGGSRTSLKSPAKPSPPKPQPRRRSGVGESSYRDERFKEINKSAISSKSLKLPRPRNVKEWQQTTSKGCFFFEDDGRISSHQYTLNIPQDTSVWITIEPAARTDEISSKEPVDTMLFILREDKSLVTFTEHRDSKGKYGVRCDLDGGEYKLIPFTTGCRFKRRNRDSESEAKLVRKKGNDFVLTAAFKDALSEIFDMCDLDSDGLMSREEFNWFNVRTSGEEVADEEWEVVEDNVTLHKGKLTKDGFMQLNQMEADDNQGDAEDLWVTLSSMGFNKGLKLDEACPFTLEAYAEDTNIGLEVTALQPGGRELETAIVEATMGKGEASKVKNMKDLTLHTYSNDFRACVVVENKSYSHVTMTLDCSKSKNCVSNKKSLESKLDVPVKSMMVGLHLMPKRETQDWSVHVSEAVIT